MSDIANKDLLDVEEVAYKLGIGRTKVYDLINRGDLRIVKIDRRTLIPAAEIPAFIARQLKEAQDA